MKGSEFVFAYFQLLHYKCHKTNTNHGGSYIDSPNWIKDKQYLPSIKKISNALNTL